MSLGAINRERIRTTTLRLIASSRRTSLDIISHFVSRPFTTRVRRLWTVKDSSSLSSSPSYFSSSTSCHSLSLFFFLPDYFSTHQINEQASSRCFASCFYEKYPFVFYAFLTVLAEKCEIASKKNVKRPTEIAHCYHINIYIYKIDEYIMLYNLEMYAMNKIKNN